VSSSNQSGLVKNSIQNLKADTNYPSHKPHCHNSNVPDCNLYG